MTNKALADHLAHQVRNCWGRYNGYEWISRTEELGEIFMHYHKEIIQALYDR